MKCPECGSEDIASYTIEYKKPIRLFSACRSCDYWNEEIEHDDGTWELIAHGRGTFSDEAEREKTKLPLNEGK